jgi:predicted DNA repair protein MutK
MASGLAALLDDVAAIAKLAAASLDDVAGAAGKAGAKALGVVVDDTAVTPSYTTGFTPDRELPIVAKIALGSLANKFLILLPAALVLSAFLPWAVTPLLMLGGAYLCYEATEKLAEVLEGHSDEEAEETLALSSAELERQKVRGAVRTDLILSGEIMAISLATVADKPLLVQAGALAAVGVLLTAAVYGIVALIVKMDDIGLHLARRGGRLVQAIGRGLVRAMAPLMSGLSGVGTAAMLWVGGGIILHGLESFHLEPLTGWIEGAVGWAKGAPAMAGLAAWLVFAILSAVAGVIVGGAVLAIVHLASRLRRA